MKNKFLAAGLVAGIIVGGTFAVGANGNDDRTVPAGTKPPVVEAVSDSGKQLTVGQATEIAKREAGGNLEEIEKETEHGRLVYKLEFEDANKESEVHIDAITGDVIKTEIDKSDDGSTKSSGAGAVSASGKQMTIEQAAEIAKRHAGGRLEGVEKETEHGRLVYKFEFEDGQKESEVYVDAITGDATTTETDDLDDDQNDGRSGSGDSDDDKDDNGNDDEGDDN